MIVTVLRDESVGPAWTWDPSVPETRWLRQNYIASNFALKIPLVNGEKKLLLIKCCQHTFPNKVLV